MQLLPEDHPEDRPALVSTLQEGAMTKEEIKSFSGSYRFLSNFWPADVVFDGKEYPSVEHAYQAAKTLDEAERKEIREAPLARDAKRLGKAVTQQSGWEGKKLGVMEDLVRQKFQSMGLRQQLLETGDAQLVEGNTWGDTFWGVCKGKGHNHLGKILMRIRDELSSK